MKPDLKLGRQLERPVVAGSGPPICPPQHDLNDWIVVEADLEFRPESATDCWRALNIDHKTGVLRIEY